jgi:hypothetical protein
VPRSLLRRRFQTLRHILSYSFLANAILGRIASEWWLDVPIVERIHRDGEDVSVRLLSRLDDLMRSRNGRFVAIALPTQQTASRARVANVVKRALEEDVSVLDLSTAIPTLPAVESSNLFRPNGHYSPAMNRWVAEQIAAFLRARVSLPPHPPIHVAADGTSTPPRTLRIN